MRVVVRRLLAVVCVVVATCSLSAGAATTRPTSRLLALSQLPRHFQVVSLSSTDTSGCPESSFRARPGEATVRIAFANYQSPDALIVEKIATSARPTAAFAAAVAVAASCRTTSHSVGGYAASQTVTPLNLGAFPARTRAFRVLVNTGTVFVDGFLLYAVSANRVLTVAEASSGALSQRGFRVLAQRALSRMAK